MDTRAALLARIDAFLAERQMTERAFGLTVAHNHKLVSRLRGGYGVTLGTIERINSFIATERHTPEATTRAAAEAA